jgi:predicted DNA-binding mobile mystery protein A
MSVSYIARSQNQSKVYEAQNKIGVIEVPAQGWLKTIRAALGLSGAELARKIGVSRSQIAQSEANEQSGTVTINTMIALAKAMGCEFKYAIVPAQGKTVNDLILAQALKRARVLGLRTQQHMVLEHQGLREEALDLQINQLAERLMLEMPSDFWSDN